MLQDYNRAFTLPGVEPLPDFRRQMCVEGPQVATGGGWLLLTAGAVAFDFFGGQTLWELEWASGLPTFALIFLLIAHLSLTFAVYRCYWPLWLTAFVGSVAFALLFAFVYLPLVRPPVFAPAPTAAPQAALPAAPDVPAAMVFCQEGGEDAPRPADDDGAAPPARPNLIWRIQKPAFGGLFLLLGPWLLYLAAAWGTVNAYRRSTSA